MKLPIGRGRLYLDVNDFSDSPQNVRVLNADLVRKVLSMLLNQITKDTQIIRSEVELIVVLWSFHLIQIYACRTSTKYHCQFFLSTLKRNGKKNQI